MPGFLSIEREEKEEKMKKETKDYLESRQAPAMAIALGTDKQDRKERPIARGVLDYFPHAIAEVARVSFIGNKQHNPGQPMHWAREKSTDHADCIARHLIERGTIDDDGMRHSAKVAWRALALLQTELEGGRAPAFLQNAQSVGVDFEYEEACKLVHFPTAEMTAQLLKLGTGEKVAKQIAYGTTFSQDQLSAAKWKFVYVAGPMRGYANYNFPAFDEARDFLNIQGWSVISPADIDRAAQDCGCSEKDLPPQHVFVFRDFFALYFIRTHCEGGAIAMLPGWEKSVGAVAEFFLARWLGLRVLDARTGEPLTLRNVSTIDLLHSVENFFRGNK